MGNKRIIVFFITGIFLCLVILFVGRKNRRFLVVPDQNASLLVKDIFDEVTAIVIEREGRRVEIRRDGSRWRMLAPVEAGVDRGVVSRLINGFDSVVVKDRLSLDEIRERGISVADYGLYPARARVAFEKPDKEVSFLFGSFSATGEDVYVRKNNQEQVLVVPRSVYDVIPQDANVLRSRRLVDCDPALVSSFDIRRPGYPFIRLAKRSSGAWFVEEPVTMAASTKQVEKFLQELCDVRVFKFVWPSLENVMDVADYESALKMRKGLYGLDDDTGTKVHLNTLDGSYDSSVVIGHKAGKIGESVFALLDEGTAIGAISNRFLDVVNIAPEYFRSMRIFKNPTGPLRRIQFVQGDYLFILSRTNDLWQIDSPASEPADQEAVQSAVSGILSLEADRIANRNQQDESDDTSVELSQVEFLAGGTNTVVSVKKADSDGTVYEFSFDGQPEVYYVAGSNMPPALVKRDALLDFRDKVLLSLPEKSIRRVTIKKFGETAFAVEYIEADESWHPVTGGIKGRLNIDAFNRVLSFLNGLLADRVVKVGLSVDDPVYYGFAEPWLEINLDVNLKDAVRKTLLVGRSAGKNMRYVMVRGDESIFVMDERRLNLFAEALIIEGE